MCVMDLLGWRLRFGECWIVMSGIWRGGGVFLYKFHVVYSFFFAVFFMNLRFAAVLLFWFLNSEVGEEGRAKTFFFLNT